MAGFISAVRATFADLVGGDDIVTPCMPDNLPASVQQAAREGAALLVEYQGAGYAQLYFDRLKRFIRRRDLDEALFCEIARLMARRMSYVDAIRMAQLKLAEPAGSAGASPAADVRRLRLDELVSSLPEVVADPVLSVIDRFGWSRMPVAMRFSAASFLGLRRLRIEAYMRRWRLLSVRYAKERVWVERWLHMIDRSLNRQPAATSAMVQSATLVQGYGDAYRHGLEAWNMIIDQLAKPTFDGVLRLPDLAAAVEEARAAVDRDPRGEVLRQTIAAIRARAAR